MCARELKRSWTGPLPKAAGPITRQAQAVAKVLPKLSRVKEHHAALPYEYVAAALQQVWESAANPATKLSLEFLVLTAARSSEVRLARW